MSWWHLDETHDPALESRLVSANGHADFPIKNRSFSVFAPRCGRLGST